MFKASKRTLTAVGVIATASAPSAAYAKFELNSSPRGVAIVGTRLRAPARLPAPIPISRHRKQTTPARGTACRSPASPVAPCADRAFRLTAR